MISFFESSCLAILIVQRSEDPLFAYKLITLIILLNLLAFALIRFYLMRKHLYQPPFCPSCTIELEENSMECGSCNLDLSSDKDLESGIIECSSCKQTVKPDSIHCPECGENLSAETNGVIYHDVFEYKDIFS